jgi:hypothetical protein
MYTEENPTTVESTTRRGKNILLNLVGTAQLAPPISPLLSHVSAMASPIGRLRDRYGDSDPSFARLLDGDGCDSSQQDAQAPTPPLVLIAFLFPALAGLNFGFDIGCECNAFLQRSQPLLASCVRVRLRAPQQPEVPSIS